MADVLRYLPSALHDVLKKAPSEAVLLDNYARVCVIVSEIVREVGCPLSSALPACRGRMRYMCSVMVQPKTSTTPFCCVAGHRGDH